VEVSDSLYNTIGGVVIINAEMVQVLSLQVFQALKTWENFGAQNLSHFCHLKSLFDNIIIYHLLWFPR
jgi:hypothetical protein